MLHAFQFALPVAVLAQGLAAGFGPLVPDPNGVFDLPAGFSYTVISQFGQAMDDGFVVADRFDGMAAFPGPNSTTILVRSHELDASILNLSPYGPTGALIPNVPVEKFYDAGMAGVPALGCTITVLYSNTTHQRIGQWLSSVGWVRPCAGAPTPWGTWLTCEEDVSLPGSTYAQMHGYAFEVAATSTMQIVDPAPRPALGRFYHEGLALDPRTGIVYQTEDRSDGLFYRFVPDTPGDLTAGTLQALKIVGMPGADLRNWSPALQYPQGSKFDAEWIDLTDIEPVADDLRIRGFAAGAARFDRGEGMWSGNGGVYFTCTSGGLARKGQIWSYTPAPDEGVANQSPGTLLLFAEPNNAVLMDNCDNITVAPWGDIFFCEDGSGTQYLVGITPQRTYYRFGRNATSTSELTGAVFSPDGSTLFVNIHNSGKTLAIRGPWMHRFVDPRLVPKSRPEPPSI